MIFKCCPNELICFFSILLAELVLKRIEIKIHSNQVIANDFNGFSSWCFRNVCNLFVFFLSFSASLVRSYGLIKLKTGPTGSMMTF